VEKHVDKCVENDTNNFAIITLIVVSVVINRVITIKKCRFPQVFA